MLFSNLVCIFPAYMISLVRVKAKAIDFSDDGELIICTSYIANATANSRRKCLINRCEYSEPSPDTNHEDPKQQRRDDEGEEAVEHLEKKTACYETVSRQDYLSKVI